MNVIHELAMKIKSLESQIDKKDREIHSLKENDPSSVSMRYTDELEAENKRLESELAEKDREIAELRAAEKKAYDIAAHWNKTAVKWMEESQRKDELIKELVEVLQRVEYQQYNPEFPKDLMDDVIEALQKIKPQQGKCPECGGSVIVQVSEHTTTYDGGKPCECGESRKGKNE